MSDLAFQCPECSKNLAVNDRYVGAMFSCPTCQTEIRAPMPTFVFPCPSCGYRLSGAEELQGQTFGCPECGNAFTVPQVGTIRCRLCRVLIEIDDEYYKELAGTLVQCPQCHGNVPVPLLAQPMFQEIPLEAETRIEPVMFKCPTCRNDITVPGESFAKMAGKLTRCGSCRRYVRVPQNDPAAAAAAPPPPKPPPSLMEDGQALGATMRLDDMLEHIPQARSLHEGRCPYCRRPLRRMDERTYVCDRCRRVIRAVRHTKGRAGF